MVRDDPGTFLMDLFNFNTWRKLKNEERNRILSNPKLEDLKGNLNDEKTVKYVLDYLSDDFNGYDPEEMKKKFLDDDSYYNRGGMVYANNGMLIPYQSRGTDTVPAMLTPGEFVINRAATQKHLPLLKAINNGSQGYSNGGVVYLNKGGQAFSMIGPRRWEDNTGNNTVIGTLDSYTDDIARIAKLNGRFTSVPLDRLSAVDQRYLKALQPIREWTDNTGNYKTQARVVNVSKHGIMIQKADKSIKDVPLNRLSEQDQDYLYRMYPQYLIDGSSFNKMVDEVQKEFLISYLLVANTMVLKLEFRLLRSLWPLHQHLLMKHTQSFMKELRKPFKNSKNKTSLS